MKYTISSTIVFSGLALLLPFSSYGLTQMIAVDGSGMQANTVSSSVGMTPDGRYVLFQSAANNLVANDTNGQQDIFIRDVINNITTRVNLDDGGNEVYNYSYAAAMTPDARYVLLYSYADTLVFNDFNGQGDAFVRDTVNNTTIRASIASDGNESNGDSYPIAITPDGRYVLFYSYGFSLVANDLNGQGDVFVRDTTSNTTIRVNVDGSGNEANNYSYPFAMSSDGRYVLFESSADNLVVNDVNGQTDIFVRDIINNTTTRVNVDNVGNEANSSSSVITMSADGRFVLFESNADNLVANDMNGQTDVFVRDIINSTTIRVNLDDVGNEANSYSAAVAITPDGRYVLFYSDADNLVANDLNGRGDSFVRDTVNNITRRISISSSGSEANSTSYATAITPDGKYVLFYSDAGNLVLNDNNFVQDVFIRDIVNNVTSIVSVDNIGNVGNSYSYAFGISVDGRYALFESPANNLVANDINGSHEVFLNERQNILPPYPIITSPNNGSAINTGNILLVGTAMDNNQVSILYLGHTYTTYADNTGVWSMLFTGLVDGSHTFYTTQLSGSTLSATGLVQFSVDQNPPLTPTITYPINNSTISGYVVTVIGTGEAGSYVYVTIGNTSAQATVDGNGDWSAGAFVLLPNNQYSANVVATDDANNLSSYTYSVFTISNTIASGYTADLYLHKSGVSDNDDNGFDSSDSTTNTFTGKDIRYNLTINNIGSGVATGVYIYETVPQNTCFTVGSATAYLTDMIVTYSNNGGASYTYMPTVSNTQDCAITHVRFELVNPMAPRNSFYNVDSDVERQNLAGWIHSPGGVYIDTNIAYTTIGITDYAGVFTSKVIDYNKDGCDDIFTLGYTTGSLLYTNDCAGGFAISYLGGGGYDGAILDDFNNDGFDDMIGVGRGTNTTYYMNIGGTGFQAIDIGTYWSLGGSSADYDNDGFKDILINGWPSYGDYLLHNTGGTGFVLSQSWAGRNALNGASADFNKDGRMDSVSVSWVAPSIVHYENTGTGVLYIKNNELGTGLEYGQTFGGTVQGDFNNDTWPDFIAIGRQQESYMYLNNTTGGFTRVPLNDGINNVYYRGVAHDFNHDGWEDFAAVTYTYSNATIYYNNHDNTFTSRKLSWEIDTYGQSDVDVGDFNNDGVDDMVWAGRVSTSKIAYGVQHRTGHYSFMIYSSSSPTLWNSLEVQESTLPGDNSITYSVYPYTYTGCQFNSGALLLGPSQANNGSLDLTSISGDQTLCVRADFELISGSIAPVLYSVFATWNTTDTSYISFDVKVLPQQSVNSISNTASIASSSLENNYQNNQDTYILQLPPRIPSGGGGGFGGGAGSNGGGGNGGGLVPPKAPSIPNINPIKPIDTTKPTTPTVIVIPQEPVKLIEVHPTTPNIAIKEAIVQTSYVSVGSVVEVKTVNNPALGTEKKCYTPKEVVDITLGKNTTHKDQLVYQALLRSYDLTMFSDTDTYMPENGLKRYEAAKMFTNFAKHVLCRESTKAYANEYTDIEGIDETLRPYIIQAYEYGILKGSNNKFRPLERISRKEFVAALMRMFTNENMDIQNVGNEWDKNYQAAFKSYGLENIVGIDEEVDRYDMSKIMYKLYYNTTYVWTERGYVLPYGRK